MFFLYYSVHSANVYCLFDVCFTAEKDVIFRQGWYMVIYFAELYITTESISSYRYVHCFLFLFILFFLIGEGGRGVGSVGTLYTYSLHLFSPVLHFLSVMWISSRYGMAGIHLTENIYTLHVIDILVDTVFLLEHCMWCAHGQHPSCDQ